MVELGPVDELELNLIILKRLLLLQLRTVSAGVCRAASLAVALEKVHRQVRRSERDDEAVFECKRHVQTHEGARTLAEVPDVVLAVVHVVLDDQVAVSDAIVLVLLNHEVIVDIAADGLLECAQNCATVVLAALRADQTLRVDAQRVAAIRFRAFDNLDLEALCLVDFLLGHHDS